ncbi:MAG: hypothetical protein MMC33_010849 [Icmadophila ericetorum]|nr:hypothetical protein [Icmadophila ericetorum]
MAKIPKFKKAQSTSLHSRAAKRASSPSIDLDKSLKSLKPPVDTTPRPKSILSAQHGNGITKKKAKGKNLTRQQRLRQEKGLERAEAVMDKKEKKVERSLNKGKKAKERNAAWDELNGKIQNKSEKKEKKVAKDEGWEDDDEEDKMEVEVEGVMPTGTDAVASKLELLSTGATSSTKPPEEEEEIL